MTAPLLLEPGEAGWLLAALRELARIFPDTEAPLTALRAKISAATSDPIPINLRPFDAAARRSDIEEHMKLLQIIADRDPLAAEFIMASVTLAGNAAVMKLLGVERPDLLTAVCAQMLRATAADLLALADHAEPASADDQNA